ncbi:MAG: VCBS repeat-containing protein, partial [Verrucomicrobia bacterium]|nr:VCBS repeat-containing protein [Verrucomicrobiota bacterium]
ITITVKDPQLATATTTFQVTVNPINYPPSITGLADQTMQENDNVSPTTLTVDFTVSDPETAAANLWQLTASAASSNGTLLPAGGIAFDTSAALTNGTRRLKLTPAAFQTGTSTVTVSLRDTGVAGPPSVTNQITTASFVLTVTAVNHAPSISLIANQVISQNGSTGPIPFNVNDALNETPASSLVVAASVVASPSSLLQATDVVFAGSGVGRTVTVTPAKNTAGQAAITLTVTDAGGLTATTQFTVVVNAVNQPPTISKIADQTTPENADTALIPFTVGDTDNPLNSLTVTGTSDKQSLVPDTSIFFGGSGGNRAMFITPALNQNGTANITVSVSDGIAAPVSTTFKLTVAFVNNPPTITSIANQTTGVGQAITGLKFIVGDIETGAVFLSFTATSSDQQLIPDSNLFRGGSGTNRTLSIFPVAGKNGQATITVTVTDSNGGSASSSFNVTVGTPNVPPPVKVKNDFNGDGLADILFQNDDGSLGVWFMNKNQNLVSASLLNPSNVGDLGWRIVATGDLNGDGKTDLIFQHTDGSVAAWIMNGVNLVSATLLTPDNPGPGWRIVGAGDVNRDGKDDILFQHTDGSIAVWLMNGTTLTTGTLLNPSSPGDSKWHVVGTADFTGVGSVDLVLQHDDGSIAGWQMNGTDLIQGSLLNPDSSGSDWRVVGTVDLDKNGSTDLLFQHADGSVAVWFMNGFNLVNASLLNPAHAEAGWKIAGPK